ncbi:alkyl/aryl-sulfatase [Leifsonia virtsii]|uniref:Alkyl sulfatase dimerization domain-containing protein n=1 Tax=Leifsonia virtsii TaxID=3035915 RepID=A0ABT8IWG8_9MICO|nr:alkyl sulfatase dimerization domain-containing protein [Leifsonia virtsii]MDN4597173.1 alkyl sulfatase dimerization domain-containing protein [Leifsonia virtsii]
MSDADETMPKDATQHTRAANRAARDTLPLSDRRDYEDAARGFVGAPADPVIRRADGFPVLDLTSHDFVDASEEAPDTVHPSLWRHAQVNNHHGLFEVAEGVYQLRGMDLANITIVEGDTGIIVIDPLSFAETARAALALYREHRGDRPVTGLVYTHSHVDHFSGSRAIVEDAHGGDFPVIAPEGFLYEAAAENVYAGTAMTRRALYMYGPLLAPGPRGQVDAGLANTLGAGGSATLVPPTDLIRETGETRTVDGVEMTFQMAPGTEAPAEFLIHFPALRLLCVAEDANHLMHNLYTLRGAQVRDAATWWKTLNQTIGLFGDDTDVLVGQHGWPRWGTADIREYLANQRDLYKFIHDETLRLANRGLTMPEIAEELRLPAGLDREWYSHGYYGSLSHNAKAVYQRYLGWYDSHPAHLNQLPPAEAGPRYVEYMGGADAVVEKARVAYDAGDYRWVAEVLTHVVFADPSNRAAALLQADAFEQLGYQSENPTWRNEYLMGALELRNGVRNLGDIQLATPDVFAAMSPEMILDFAGIKLDAGRTGDEPFALGWTVTDADGGPATFLLEVRNGVLVYTRDGLLDGTVARASSSKAALAAALFGGRSLDDLVGSGDASVEGDRAAVDRLFGMLDDFPLWFPIVQP